ncbi:hypothetical protein MSAN_02333700 [Mycena sanguinolenta]|uniref:Secreted protein n=1 Tax=Mycena sanguinolenta TaxID=230812 RepID=A0A8H7CH48_9AGAR|nr:hypothetical protein MSAN_02333700 [Mycena sanguinolenta]
MLSVFVFFALVATTLAAENGPCSSGPGVCISTSSCTAGGGSYTSGLCPNDPDDIKCCTKAPCASASLGGGQCLFTSNCTGGNHYVLTGLCPGPSNFKCCLLCIPGRRSEEESGELDKRLPICWTGT